MAAYISHPHPHPVVVEYHLFLLTLTLMIVFVACLHIAFYVPSETRRILLDSVHRSLIFRLLFSFLPRSTVTDSIYDRIAFLIPLSL
jgi:hypothetical protein